MRLEAFNDNSDRHAHRHICCVAMPWDVLGALPKLMGIDHQ